MRFRSFGFLLLSLWTGLALAADPPTGLQPPTKVTAGGKAIDAPTAAPFLGDFKGDGTQCLLVGQGDGKMRIYANQAGVTAGAGLRFDTFSWFLDGKPEGTVPGGADAGFTPHLVANGSRTDIFSGSSSGDLYVFRGKDKAGTYAAAVALTDKAGPLRVAGASSVFAFDWRGTGKLDLLVGNIDGSVSLIPNNGTDKKDEYGTPQKLEADGKAIKVPMGHSHPIAADWDKDGKPGLIVGTGAGSVLLFRNIGSRTEPKLGAAQTLVAESALAANKDAILRDNQWGLRAQVCAVDWNGDGFLDLLVGDSVAPKTNAKTPADVATEKKLRADLARFDKDNAKAQEKMRALEKAPAKETPKAKQEREKQLQEQKNLSTKLQQEMADAQKQIAKLEAAPTQTETHGHVWLFLRKPTDKSVGNQ